MKTIIVPTDFSPVSINAMHYAANMASSIGASIILFHAYQIPVAFSEVPVVSISIEEMKKINDDKYLRKSELQSFLKSVCASSESFKKYSETRGKTAYKTLNELRSKVK